MTTLSLLWNRWLNKNAAVHDVKVAYIIGGLPFGGIERWLYDLCLEYRKNGLVRTRVFNVSGTGELLPEYLEAGIDVNCIAGSKRALVTYRFDTTNRLRKALKSYAPDIIHTMHFTANYHGRLAAAGLGIPVIVHLRNIKHERRLFRRAADKALSWLTTRYLAVSKAVAEVVRSDHNLAGRPVQVLYNAVMPSRLEHAPLDLKELYGFTAPVVLSVGRYVPQKNLDLLLRAVALLRDAGRQVCLVMVGEGPERAKLEDLRAQLGLEDRVALAGFRSDVPAFLKAADIFAMPSDFEGLPIAHLEAMYCGLPAVLSEHVPSLEIASGASLVCKLEPADIAAKIDLLLSDADLRSRLSQRAVAVASEHTMEKYALALYDVYTLLSAS
ncbi:glycosyltransferase [Desulfovibrio sp. OttesenSCG-928-A18]|nr:glycosyltransferase [Desulfovibrio sp. OttesenSCG-928-A18]